MANLKAISSSATLMIFCSRNKAHPNMSVYIDGEAISETSKTKFLGVIIIDNRLEGPYFVHIRINR